MVRFLAGVGGERGKPTGGRTIPIAPENKTLTSELVVVKETFFLDNTLGIRYVDRVKVFVAGEERAR